MQKQSLPTRSTNKVTTLPEPVTDGTGPQPVPKPSRRTWTFARLRALLRQPLPRAVVIAFMAAGIIGLMALTVYSAVSLSQGVELRAFEQHLNDQSTDGTETHLVAQSFRSDHPNLNEVALQVSSIGGMPEDGQYMLVKGDGPSGEVVYEGKLSDASFANNPFLEFRFPAVAASEGVTFTLVLTSPTAPLSNSVGLLYSSFDSLSAGRMFMDDGAERGDLVISAFYQYGPAEWLGDIGQSVTGGIWPLLVWVLLLMLPGMALLVWLPSSLSVGQRVLAAPGVTLLALPVLFLFTRAIGLSFGGVTMWLLLLVCLLGTVAALVRPGRVAKLPKVDVASVAFWSLLGLVMAGALASRMMSLHDLPAGLGLDAYHHTLIAQMFVQNGGIPSDYLPFAPLSSFTYHFGFHDMIASAAWLLGQTSPVEIMKLMPQAGQIATALPVLTLTLFGWKVTGDRWAGLVAGALAGLLSIFPAYYVNWSRYTQGLGLTLLPVSMVLYLEVVRRPVRPPVPKGDAAGQAGITWQSAIGQSGPYLLGVIGAAGLFLTHYRIAIVYAVFVGLYLVGRLVMDLRHKATFREVIAPGRRTLVLALLALGTLSPWLVNLAQNFRSHLVGRNLDTARDYYDLGGMVGWGLITDWTMQVMLVLAVVGLVLAVRARQWVLLLAVGVWIPLALWSDPYLLDGIVPGIRLPYAGYLDVGTVAQSVWLPLAMLAGYAVARVAEWFMGLGKSTSTARTRVWQVAAGVVMGVALLVVGLAVAQPVAANLDKKMYITDGDEQAMLWMRDNLPKNAFVLANPFAFGWAPGNVYGSDSGMWVPLVAGVSASVPPLPAYNEQLADPAYTDKILDVIHYEPFHNVEADWQALKNAGVTHIYVGSRGGALDVPQLLQSDHTQLLFHRDGAFVFELR